MTFSPVEPASPSSVSGPPPAPSGGFSLATIFVGAKGLRSLWRLLIFIGLLYGIGFALRKTLFGIPWVVNHILKRFSTGSLNAGVLIFNEGFLFVIIMISVLVMKAIEKKRLADYGIPGVGILSKRFWQGVPYGFSMLSLLLVAIGAFHGMSLGGITLDRHDAIKYGFLYAIGFLLVGLCEEISFRGYMQATLTDGIGFWPAALVLSCLFGYIHLGNSGEAIFGAVMAGSFGLLAAFSLARTGSLWFAIGMHAAWDWGETYFYGTPDSGLVASGHLYSASFHGARWLTGGSVGPEGSYFALAVLIVGGLGIHLLFPAKNVTPRAA
jgi:membrane protease YdiL (CAAX protease family)